ANGHAQVAAPHEGTSYTRLTLQENSLGRVASCGSRVPSCGAAHPPVPDVQRFLPVNPEAWKTMLFRMARCPYGWPDADEWFSEWARHVDTGLGDERLYEEWQFAKSKVRTPPRIDLDRVAAKAAANAVPEWIRAALPKNDRLQKVLAFLW